MKAFVPFKRGKQDKEDKDYEEKYDPVGYKSELTGRGPLGKDWMETSKPVMCCYKLIKVDVKFWGIQTKTENTIIIRRIHFFK